ncbi:MAG: DEAD/DEAH box helicase, partial [Treponema sp.]|nr:DEAD/DEAH box helicase [Treponema sp.]
MNTLSFPGLPGRIASSQPVAACISAYREGKFPLEIEGTEGVLSAALIAALAREKPGTFLVVVPSDSDAADFAMDLSSMGLEPLVFPWWGTVPYRETAPLSAVFGERAGILSALAAGEKHVVIVPMRAFLSPLPPPGYIQKLLVRISPGGIINTTSLAETLAGYGYTRVPRVQVRGEFALRGEVLDILMGDDTACRVLFDFDRVESIRAFDPMDQAGREKLPELRIRPMREVLWTDDRIETLSAVLSRSPEFSENGGTGGRLILEELMERRHAEGEELFYPLAFEKPAVFTDYLGGDGTVFYLDSERLFFARESLQKEYHGLYARTRTEREVPLPERILLDFRDLFPLVKRRVSFRTLKGEAEKGAFRFHVPCDPPRSFFGNIDYLREEFSALFARGYTIVVAAESQAQADRIRTLFADTETLPGGALIVTAAPISCGFSLPDLRLMVIQENEIFGRRKRVPRSFKTVRSEPIDTFVELNAGDYVVHVNYGIGLFRGIERVRALGHERDYIKLEYLEGEVVFVPIEQVNLVQRYIGSEGSPPRLDRMGSKSWESRKGRVKKSVEDLAEKLLALYSKRKETPGFAFPPDTEWQTMYEASFPFEETGDQLRCAREIKEDMESPHPMDRLVCGDVGYGKTEVALRACFKAIMAGKQAAFLAPTTILAEQHFENFSERFSRFPVKVAMLSRFVEGKRAREILEQTGKGSIDLLVGTHRIIQNDVRFRDLGLIVIDEEQRFGVRDKERLKELKVSVDCLSLSATPIPRTLHMSLLKIRDLSILATAPMNRRPIETEIGEWNGERVAWAIRREAERGGQVFFLHNRIESLGETRMKIERLV